MSDIYYKKLYSQLKSFSYKKPFPSDQDKEDFISYAIEKIFNGRKATFDQLFIDYLRTNIADTRANNYEIKKNLNKPKQYEEFMSLAVTQDVDSKNNFKESLISNVKIEDLNIRDRAIIILFFYYQFTQKEISHIFGVDKSRISQIISKVKYEIIDINNMLPELDKDEDYFFNDVVF
jgi:RNA polymerase sigma factor (sigma-70 family)